MTANQIKAGLGALAVAGAVTALVIQHQAQMQLRAENQSLQQQVAQLVGGMQDLSNRLTDAGDDKKISDDQMNELLRLRGEVGVLRRQTSEVGQLQAAVQNLQARPAAEQTGAPTQVPQLAPEDQFQLHQMHMVNAMKQLALGMRIYEGDHNGQLPTNLDQLIQSGDLGSVTNGFTFTYVAGVPDVIGMENFELMNVGQVSDSTPGTLMIRERIPRQSPDGPWQRVYAFADGSVQSLSSNDGNFDNYEAQHSSAPPSQ
jgi:hypothetical protein